MSGRVKVSLGPDASAWLEARAKEQDRSVSWVLRKIVEEAMAGKVPALPAVEPPPEPTTLPAEWTGGAKHQALVAWEGRDSHMPDEVFVAKVWQLFKDDGLTPGEGDAPSMALIRKWKQAVGKVAVLELIRTLSLGGKLGLGTRYIAGCIKRELAEKRAAEAEYEAEARRVV